MRHLICYGLSVMLIWSCQNKTSVSPPQQPSEPITVGNKIDTIIKKKKPDLPIADPQATKKPSPQSNTIQEKKKAPKKQIQKPKRKFSIIKFDSTTIHLPDMMEGDVADIEFKFWNEGDGPLTIDEVDVTCGCTTPSIPFLDILPGDTSQIRIQYKSVGKSGLQQPEITVKSNGKPKFTVLKLEVLVKENLPDSVKTVRDTLPN